MADKRDGDGSADVLRALETQDPRGLDRLFELLYKDLRALAAGYLRAERADHTLQPTALVNEAYLRLAAGSKPLHPRGRQQFLALAARAMRRVLVDNARRRGGAKRGAGWTRVTLDPGSEPVAGGDSDEVNVLALDAELEKLAREHERAARVFELRAFSGMTIAETASLIEVSASTVEDDWALAKAWLTRALRRR